MTNEDSVNTYLISFGRNIKDTSSHIFINSLGFYPSSENLSNFFLKLYMPFIGEKFEIYDVQITGKCIGYLNWKYKFLLMPSSKTLPQVHIITTTPPSPIHI